MYSGICGTHIGSFENHLWYNVEMQGEIAIPLTHLQQAKSSWRYYLLYEATFLGLRAAFHFALHKRLMVPPSIHWNLHLCSSKCRLTFLGYSVSHEAAAALIKPWWSGICCSS